MDTRFRTLILIAIALTVPSCSVAKFTIPTEIMSDDTAFTLFFPG